MLGSLTSLRCPRASLSSAWVRRAPALPKPHNLTLAYSLPSLVRRFSTTAPTAPVVRPSKDISHLPRSKPPLEIEAEKQLAIGNPAEAYGLHPDAGLVGKSGIWEKYGYWSTFGLFAVAAISKEWYIIDEEIILVSTFASAFFAAYVSFREPVAQAIQEGIDEEKKAAYEDLDKNLDTLDREVLELKEMLTLPQSIGPQLDEDVKMAESLAEATENRFHAELNALTEAQLAYVEQQEQKLVSDFSRELASGVNAHVEKAFTVGPNAAKLKSDAFDMAVTALSGEQPKTNPVAPLVSEYLNIAGKTLPKKSAELGEKLKERISKVNLLPAKFPTRATLETEFITAGKTQFA